AGRLPDVGAGSGPDAAVGSLSRASGAVHSALAGVPAAPRAGAAGSDRGRPGTRSGPGATAAARARRACPRAAIIRLPVLLYKLRAPGRSKDRPGVHRFIGPFYKPDA